MAGGENTNGWAEHKRLIIASLDRLQAQLECVDRKLENLRVDVAVLKVKAGAWGAVAGAVTVGVPLLVWMLSKLG